jgi:hypothetical protein
VGRLGLGCPLLTVTCCASWSSCCDCRGCVLLVIGWERRVQWVCFPSYTRTHTFKTKKICTCYQRCCRIKEGLYTPPPITHPKYIKITHKLTFLKFTTNLCFSNASNTYIKYEINSSQVDLKINISFKYI